MVTYTHSKPAIGKEEIDIAAKVLQSQQLEDGYYVRKLENDFCNFLNRKYAVAVINGFAAIHLSLIALNIKQNDEVIIPSYSCPALLNPVLIVGAKPVIVDIEKKSFNIDVEQVKKSISKRTKAIIVPHTFGFPAKIDLLQSLNIPIIEDCAQAIGGNYLSKKLGAFGNISIFSFYATKVITGGDGGMIVTDDIDIYNKLLDYRYYGSRKNHKVLAMNYHLTNIPAAIISVQLKKINSFVKKRVELACEYDKLLNNNKIVRFDFVNKEHSIFYRYPVFFESGSINDVKNELADKGVNCGFGVLEGMHQLFDYNINSFKNTDKYLSGILSLPIYPALEKKDINIISNNLLQIINA